MPYLNKVPINHYCERPPVSESGTGSVWQCEICKRTWKLVVDLNQTRYLREWVEIEESEPHHCQLPGTEYGVGFRWRCNECKTMWMLLSESIPPSDLCLVWKKI